MDTHLISVQRRHSLGFGRKHYKKGQGDKWGKEGRDDKGGREGGKKGGKGRIRERLEEIFLASI